MSSNIKIERVCDHCGNIFTAKTTVTRFCSDRCAKRNYKKRQREIKEKKSHAETVAKLSLPIELIKSNELITVDEIVKLIRVIRNKIYRLVDTGRLRPIKLLNRTLFCKKEILKMLNFSEQMGNVEMAKTENTEMISFPQILNSHPISEKTLYAVVKKHGIAKEKIHGTNYVNRYELERIIGKITVQE